MAQALPRGGAFTGPGWRVPPARGGALDRPQVARSPGLCTTRDNTGQLRVSLSSPSVRQIVPTQTELSVASEPDEKMVPAAMLALVEQERERDRVNFAAELTRISSLHLDLVGRLQAQAATERSLFLERVDAAELRAEAAEARATAVDEKLHQVLDRLLDRQTVPTSIPEPTRSWWARWFGHSKRSDLDG